MAIAGSLREVGGKCVAFGWAVLQLFFIGESDPKFAANCQAIRDVDALHGIMQEK